MIKQVLLNFVILLHQKTATVCFLLVERSASQQRQQIGNARHPLQHLYVIGKTMTRSTQEKTPPTTANKEGIESKVETVGNQRSTSCWDLQVVDRLDLQSAGATGGIGIYCIVSAQTKARRVVNSVGS